MVQPACYRLFSIGISLEPVYTDDINRHYLQFFLIVI